MNGTLIKQQEIINSSEKIHKVLARTGIASRREMEGWIINGRVKVNNKEARLGLRVTSNDIISVDGKVININSFNNPIRRVLLYNKPLGEVCTRKDTKNRPTTFRNFPLPTRGRWISIGRLDINTTGLLMFTTDGDLANRLMHPSYGIDREYMVRIRGTADSSVLERLQSGVLLDDGLAKFTDIKPATPGNGSNQWYYCVIMEGRSREVRRLWASQGLIVSRLKRVRFGSVFLNSKIPMGSWYEMNQVEVNSLSSEVNLPPTTDFIIPNRTNKTDIPKERRPYSKFTPEKKKKVPSTRTNKRF